MIKFWHKVGQYCNQEEILSTKLMLHTSNRVYFFPPFSCQFLTPLRSGQIWGENRRMYRGVCLLKVTKIAQKQSKIANFSPANSPVKYTPSKMYVVYPMVKLPAQHLTILITMYPFLVELEGLFFIFSRPRMFSVVFTSNSIMWLVCLWCFSLVAQCLCPTSRMTAPSTYS